MTIPPEAVWVLVAVFGGLARYLDTYIKEQKGFSWQIAVSSVVVCGFTGFIAAEVMLLVYPQWALVSAGIGGYLGTEMMSLLLGVWKNKISIGGETKNGSDRK